MTPLIAVILLAGNVFSTVAVAQSNAPVPVLPDTLRWVSLPNGSESQAAWVLGAEQQPGPYIIRVKLATGASIPPYTHPDERTSTVLAGTLYVGFGETFDATKVVAMPTGAVYVVPANVPHYSWAKDGEAMYQEVGVEPTGTSFITR